MIYLHTLNIGSAEVVPAYHKLYEEWGYLLLSDYEFSYRGVKYKVPAGFWFNGASIPKLFWQVICSPFDPRILEAALVHDWLYTSKILEREQADEYLLCSLKGFNRLQEVAIHRAVRLGGGLAWRDNKLDLLYWKLFLKQLETDGRDPKHYLLPTI